MPSYQIQQLAQLCNAHPLARKVVLVPSVQAGSALGAALARSGTSWINVRFATPEDIAREISEPGLIAQGWRPLPKDADLIELAPILRAYLVRSNNVYFRNQTFSQGLLRSIHRTLRALRISGTSAKSLLGQRGDDKLRALAHLYWSYEDCLETKRWFDGPDLFKSATTQLTQQENELWPEAVYAILDETPLPGLAQPFVDALTNGDLIRIGRSDYGTAIPETIAANSLSKHPLLCNIDCEPAGRILCAGSDDHDLDHVDLVRTTGPEIEIRTALDRTLANDLPLDEVEIVCTTPDLLTYAYDAITKLDIPATFGAGVSILSTRAGQAVRATYEWVATGDDFWLDALLSGRLLNANLTAEKISKLLRDLRKVAATPKTRAAQLARLGAQLLTDHVTTLTESEEPARDSLIRRLEDLSEHSDTEEVTSDCARTLLDVIDQHRFEALSPRPGHINVVPLDRAGFSDREHLFIIGLDSASFPGTPGEDPLLLDHERERVSGELELLRTRPLAQVWHLTRVLGLAHRVTLTASVYSPADGQESEPASLFHHMRSKTAEPTFISLIGDRSSASDLASWKLSWARSAGHPDALTEYSPWLFEGRAADLARSSSTFTRYKGITTATDALDSQTIWSASRLETLARCPMRYLWRYLLGIQPPAEDAVDATRWLSPLDFGSLLHELYQKFMTDIQDRLPDPERDEEHIRQILKHLIDRTSREHPPPNPLAYETDVARLETAAHVFLSEESKRPTDHRPKEFEVSFGFEAEGGLNHPEPVSLSLGDVDIQLRGLIDRVDETADGYVIWDYKTGSANAYNESDLLGGGQHLQWALYAHALSEILSQRDEGGPIVSGYYFASDREHGRKMKAPPPDRENLGDLLRPILGLASKGAFPPIQKTPQCRFCDYKSICEKDQMLPRALSTGPEKDTNTDLIELASEWLSN
ncbi:PD-(D/E)XK nuclease family protein [bacterium]|nr:PD-(D/E)XK nuclease family protein [bacterium]